MSDKNKKEKTNTYEKEVLTKQKKLQGVEINDTDDRLESVSGGKIHIDVQAPRG